MTRSLRVASTSYPRGRGTPSTRSWPLLPRLLTPPGEIARIRAVQRRRSVCVICEWVDSGESPPEPLAPDGGLEGRRRLVRGIGECGLC